MVVQMDGTGQNFEIIEELAILTEYTNKGWRIVLNIVSWRGGEPKFDLLR